MLILVTGGTLDKRYDPISGTLSIDHSHLSQLLIEARLTADHSVNQLMLKDSLDLNIIDRMRMLEACREYEGRQIVITHGTDTMTETADFLHNANLDKTIVLTGAMRPFSFGHSDASFNLGFALACAQHLPVGTYIAMNGQAFLVNQVKKDKQRGCFVSL